MIHPELAFEPLRLCFAFNDGPEKSCLAYSNLPLKSQKRKSRNPRSKRSFA